MLILITRLSGLAFSAKFFRIDYRRLFEQTSWEGEQGKPPYIIYLEEKEKKETKEVIDKKKK